MNQWTPRTVSGAKFFGIGMLLLVSTDPVVSLTSGNPLLTSLAQLLCSGLGLIFFAIGAYRLATRHRAK